MGTSIGTMIYRIGQLIALFSFALSVAALTAGKHEQLVFSAIEFAGIGMISFSAGWIIRLVMTGKTHFL